MKWFNHNSLCENDLALLAGTPTMERLQQNRLIILYEPNATKPSTKELGLDVCKELFCARVPQDRRGDDTVEILFTSLEDMALVENHLTQFKLGQE
jgi:hypothetical protein